MQETEIEYVSAYTFGERKGVSSTAVYLRVNKGDIEITMIGKQKLIDWNKFKDVEFPRSVKILATKKQNAKKAK
jgi:uncharacterized protein YqhQ